MNLLPSFRPRSFALASALLLCACNGAEWSNLKAARGYSRPRNGVNITVVASAPGSDDLMDDLTTTLVADLREDGIEATVDLASPGSEQVSLNIAEWNPGDRAVRYFVGLGAGEGHVVLVVDVKDPRGATVFHGRLRGYVAAGAFGGSAHDSLKAAAQSIADVIATGQTE